MSETEDKRDRERRRAPNSPRRQRITKEPEARRQEIIETALALLEEKGYDNLNVQDITERMNVSPGLCYRYFKSKTDIFAAAAEYYAVKMAEQLAIPFPADLTAAEKLETMISRIFRFTMDHREFEFHGGGGDLRAVYLDKVAGQWCGLMLPVIKQGIDEGQFRCGDPDAATHFLLYGLIHTFHRRTPGTKAEDYMASFLNFTYDMFSRVLGLPEGTFTYREPGSQQ